MDLIALGYTEEWIKTGMLAPEDFKLQLVQFRKGADQNKEHYRYITFCKWLNKLESLDNGEIQEVLNILENDEDLMMSTAAIIDLYCSNVIKEKQKGYIVSNVNEDNLRLKKELAKCKMRSAIRSNRTTSEMLEKCWNSKEIGLLKLIAEYTSDQDFLKRLSTFEYSKKIRNIANSKLNTKHT